MSNLPDNFEVCSMVYVPRVGYLLAVQPWTEEQIDENELESMFGHLGLQFAFYSNGIPHFKNGRCLDLDSRLGDTFSKICDREMGIQIKLTEFILSQTDSLLHIVQLASYLDCLIAMSLVSSESGWIRPVITKSGPLDIVNGRHPLQELCVPTFVPNSTLMGRSTSQGKNNSVNFKNCRIS